jgi:uncharacterized protein
VAAVRFDWDERKEAQNRRRHGVSFEEAHTVFFDDHALVIADPDHSATEDRFVVLGLSSVLRELVVCHCYRGDDVIRIISARKANRAERAQYHRRVRR